MVLFLPNKISSYPFVLELGCHIVAGASGVQTEQKTLFIMMSEWETGWILTSEGSISIVQTYYKYKGIAHKA